MDLMSANAFALLAATPSDWRHGLGKDSKAMMLSFRRLAHRWHPDHCADPKAAEVFARLQKARQEWGQIGKSKVQIFRTDRGTRLEMKYSHAFTDELGETYIGHRTLLTAYLKNLKDLADMAAVAPHLWSFSTPSMREQIAPLLPQAVTVHLTPDRVIHVSARDPALIRLADLMAHLGQLDPKHVAWIGSGLWNLACYFEHIGLAHQAISIDNLWLDPAAHRVALLGGWAYAGGVNQRWVALPGRSQRLASQSMLDRKVHTVALDHVLIRALLRELLGDASGMRAPTDVPPAMAAFARLPASGSAVAQYAAWKQALVTSFGKPQFVELALPPSLIYPEN
jgi:hypothetical protein